jgi:hypothetical protein
MKSRHNLACIALFALVLTACESEKATESSDTSTQQAAHPIASAAPSAKAAATEVQPAASQPRPATGLGAACSELCKKTAQLGCSNHSACVPACQRSFDLPLCPAEVTAFLVCANMGGVEAWECSDQGTPALKDGQCDREQEAVIACVDKANRQ